MKKKKNLKPLPKKISKMFLARSVRNTYFTTAAKNLTKIRKILNLFILK